MSKQNETMADIVREMRKGFNQSWRDVDREWAHDLADRIEAAHERECGNAAKMREALEKARDNFAAIGTASLGDGITNGVFMDSLRIICAKMTNKIADALSAPLRNCDVLPAGEQSDRFVAYCRTQTCEDYKKHPCENCALFKNADGEYCEFAWAQMQYPEGGAK